MDDFDDDDEDYDDLIDVGDIDEAEDEAREAVLAVSEIGPDDGPGVGIRSPQPPSFRPVEPPPPPPVEGPSAPALQEPPEPIAWYLPDLLAKAAYFSLAHQVDREFHDVVIHGMVDDYTQVQEGYMYFCETPEEGFDMRALAQAAVANGAAAIITDDAQIGDQMPGELPVLWVPDVPEFATRLAVAWHNAPSANMHMVGVLGCRGTAVVSWLIRGVLEEAGQLTGLMGSIEYAVAEERLDSMGEIWRPDEDQEEEEAKIREMEAAEAVLAARSRFTGSGSSGKGKLGAAAEAEEVERARQEVLTRPLGNTPFHYTPYGVRYRVPETTPEGLTCQKVLAGMKDRGATAAVMEVSLQALSDDRLDWVDFDVLVYTSTSDEVLDDTFEDVTDYDEALENQLTRLTSSISQRMVLNADDPRADAIREMVGGAQVVTYSARDGAGADVWAETVKLSLWETELLVTTPVGRLQIISPLIGRPAVHHILAAIATGVAMDIPLQAIVAGIESVEVVPGRMEVIDEGQPFPVVVDAADRPEALGVALDALRECGARRIITVMGCPGANGDYTGRARITEVAHAKSDVIIFTNDSPFNEPPEYIIDDMISGLPDDIINMFPELAYFPFQDQTRVPLWFEPYLHHAQLKTQRHVVEDRFSAIRGAIGMAEPRDVVLIAGRGHVDHVDFPGEEKDSIARGWFDDRVEARNALASLALLYSGVDRAKTPWGDPLPDYEEMQDYP